MRENENADNAIKKIPCRFSSEGDSVESAGKRSPAPPRVDVKKDTVVGNILCVEEDIVGKSHGIFLVVIGREKATGPPWIGGKCACCREPTEVGVTKLMLLSTSMSAKRREDDSMVLAFIEVLLGWIMSKCQESL